MKYRCLCLILVLASSALSAPLPETTVGACEGKENRQYIYDENHEFADYMSTCVVKDYLRFTASLDTSCLKYKYKDMTNNCLDCFAAMTKCTADNCVSDCKPRWLFGYGEQSEQCKACRLKVCGDAMQKCSGVQASTLPDFKR